MLTNLELSYDSGKLVLCEIEKLEITCLVDNNVDILLPHTPVARRASIPGNWHEHPLMAEHGFSAALTLQTDGTTHRILLDSGLDPFVASHNADVLGFDLSFCESVISSHGHIDHTGGLLNIRKKMNQKNKVPLVIHKDAFRNRVVKFQDGRSVNLPAPDRSSLTEAGYEIVERNSHSSWIKESILVTGEIPRTNNFERGLANHFSQVESGELEADPLIRDDQAVILNVKDKGLVVATGCGHAGIINTLHYAKELTGVDTIYAVLGGMHLSGGLFEPIIGRTIEELEGLKPRFVVPCHCSGLKAVTEIARRMPDAFIQNGVGTSYLF
jgi:7,8-dihydropterin-6-yl-methyl-4-(beta-D-ribofuranosyl)aminobenzene 5'-phosphate synthase